MLHFSFDRSIEKFTKVSIEKFPGALKLRIDHIALASKVVPLVERYEIDTERLFMSIKDICSLEEFVSHIEKLKELPDDWIRSIDASSRR